MKVKRRQYAVIRQYDYVSKEEFQKHRVEMEKKGYILVEGFFSKALDPYEMEDGYWKYSASFIKSDLM